MIKINIFLMLILFLLILYIFFPQVLPDPMNKDIDIMRNEIFISHIGVQENNIAKNLCETYGDRFWSMQRDAVRMKIKLLNASYNNSINFKKESRQFLTEKSMKIIEDEIQHKIMYYSYIENNFSKISLLGSWIPC